MVREANLVPRSALRWPVGDLPDRYPSYSALSHQKVLVRKSERSIYAVATRATPRGGPGSPWEAPAQPLGHEQGHGGPQDRHRGGLERGSRQTPIPSRGAIQSGRKGRAYSLDPLHFRFNWNGAAASQSSPRIRRSCVTIEPVGGCALPIEPRARPRSLHEGPTPPDPISWGTASGPWTVRTSPSELEAVPLGPLAKKRAPASAVPTGARRGGGGEGSVPGTVLALPRRSDHEGCAHREDEDPIPEGPHCSPSQHAAERDRSCACVTVCVRVWANQCPTS